MGMGEIGIGRNGSEPCYRVVHGAKLFDFNVNGVNYSSHCVANSLTYKLFEGGLAVACQKIYIANRQ